MTGKSGSDQMAKGKGVTRVLSARQMIAEVVRDPEASFHVASPEAPIRLLGMDLNMFLEVVEDEAAKATDSQGRKLRPDANVMLAGVAAYPVFWADLVSPTVEFDSFEWRNFEKWVESNLAFLRDKHGDMPGYAMMHTDERYPHLHYAVKPQLGDDTFVEANTRWGKKTRIVRSYSIEDIHVGYRAKAKAAGKSDRSVNAKKARDDAYRRAMRDLQDRYEQAVAIPCGLTRPGPRRRRLSGGRGKRKRLKQAPLQRRVMRQSWCPESQIKRRYERSGMRGIRPRVSAGGRKSSRRFTLIMSNPRRRRGSKSS